MRVLVGEHAAESSQPCREGAIRGRITALEVANEEYWLRGIWKRELHNEIFPSVSRLVFIFSTFITLFRSSVG